MPSHFADREGLQDALKRVRNDADALLTRTKLEPLREALLHSIRDIIEAHEWLSSSRQIGEAGAVKLAAISLIAASDRLAYVTQLRDTYGAGVMFHE